ncbi:ATP-dependent endonuclease [Staphylococcus aureus]|uniref:ATP-dependent nuclease n=1 Tax=Staphylococcus aureus TaxID=1280 RepID=UPI0021D28B76|nr:AAA family ATPase [Staphylococcus aureus]UXT63184.1 AAA family ATPase [Staphylococcus aureus]UXT70116.1 AAA family ATPase [Staphylococcus aureus]UXT94131.1 AAA family ATPase [Staphylococcus aureus]UXU12443.1 AAA family ATPase [Staphylococcus aureus]WOL34690.1 AAA family ATPase [Staphylococcus aureus]
MSLSKIIIKGFKKFKCLELDFNEHFSVLVGENEVGKSTILSAIDIVLNQAVFLPGNTSYQRYFNSDLVEKFFETRTKESLPKIEIELFLHLSNDLKNSYFSGLHYNDSEGIKTGIRFVYEFDEDFISDVNFKEFADNKIIPTDYYKASWNTFQGKSYKKRMTPLKMIYLDNSTTKYDLFGNYARQIYGASVDKDVHRDIVSSFRKKVSEFQQEYDEKLTIHNNQKFGLDSNKTDFLKLIDIFESNISIQDLGKGKENIIRTEMSLSNEVFDLVLIDEPESHLSHTRTRKLIETIKSKGEGQLVIASHSSLIVNRLNLINTIIISNNKTKHLNALNEKAAKYFEKLDNLDVLRFILSEKVILVEGAAEYIIIPKLFEILTDNKIDRYGIEVISMGSISYENYRELSKLLNKKVAVITDNDGKNLECYDNNLFQIFSESSTDNWTMEVSFYNENIEFFDKYYDKKTTKAEYNGKDYPKALAHMLKNKTNNALEIEQHLTELKIPKYLKEAISWIKE